MVNPLFNKNWLWKFCVMDDNRKNQLRSQEMYQRYNKLLVKMRTDLEDVSELNLAKMLLLTHWLVDDNNQYRYASHSYSAHQAIQVLIEDELPEGFMLMRL